MLFKKACSFLDIFLFPLTLTSAKDGTYSDKLSVCWTSGEKNVISEIAVPTQVISV